MYQNVFELPAFQISRASTSSRDTASSALDNDLSIELRRSRLQKLQHTPNKATGSGLALSGLPNWAKTSAGETPSLEVSPQLCRRVQDSGLWAEGLLGLDLRSEARVGWVPEWLRTREARRQAAGHRFLWAFVTQTSTESPHDFQQGLGSCGSHPDNRLPTESWTLEPFTKTNEMNVCSRERPKG